MSLARSFPLSIRTRRIRSRRGDQHLHSEIPNLISQKPSESVQRLMMRCVGEDRYNTLTHAQLLVVLDPRCTRIINQSRRSILPMSALRGNDILDKQRRGRSCERAIRIKKGERLVTCGA